MTLNFTKKKKIKNRGTQVLFKNITIIKKCSLKRIKLEVIFEDEA